MPAREGDEAGDVSGIRRITFTKPDLAGPRGLTMLATTDTVTVIVQSLQEGARQGLHAHAAYDGLYWVLGGRARFFGEGGSAVEIAPGEGVFVPRGTPYGFEAIGGEAQLLSVDAIDKTVADEFLPLEPGSGAVDYQIFSPDGTPRPPLAWRATGVDETE